MSLWADFLTNDQRMIHKWKHYFPAYERHLERFRNQDVVLFEIGCGAGGSLQMWKRFLGPHARVVGLDIRPECGAFAEDQVSVCIGDQADAGFLHSVLAEFGTPDIVIDDGSHMAGDTRAAFGCLYPKVAKSGVYIVEDLHTAYWPKYDGGLRREGTFIETVKDLIDELNAEHTRGALPPSAFTHTTLGMHIYDSMVVFERGRHTSKRASGYGVPDAAYGRAQRAASTVS